MLASRYETVSADSLLYRPAMKESHTHERAVHWAISVAVFGVLPVFLTGAFAVQIRSELGFGQAALGAAISLFFVTQALSSTPFGRLVERVGSRRGMQVAALGSAGSLLCIALFANSWYELVLFLTLGGLANAASQLSASFSLARQVPLGSQGLAFGLKEAAKPTATLLSGLAVPLFAATFGWRWAFVIYALGALTVAYTMPDTNDDRIRRRLHEPKGDIHRAPLILLALGAGLAGAAATPLGTFVVESGVVAGLSVGVAGILSAMGSVVCIIVRIAFGWAADQQPGGQLRNVAAMLALGTVGFVLLAAGTGWSLVAGTLLAFGAGWGWVGLFSFAVIKHNPGAPAAATGIALTGAACGAAVGPALFGTIIELTSFGTAWLCSGIGTLLAAAIILVGRRMLIRRLTDTSKAS